MYNSKDKHLAEAVGELAALKTHGDCLLGQIHKTTVLAIGDLEHAINLIKDPNIEASQDKVVDLLSQVIDKLSYLKGFSK